MAGREDKFSKDLKETILRRGTVTEEQAQRFDWQELLRIQEAHKKDRPHLEPVANYVSERLRHVSEVHSIRVRIKNPDHVVEKIIRKQLTKATSKNYKDLLTDLIGIRALHLFKDGWKQIHDFVTDTWDQAEQPTAYVREGDSTAWSKVFEDPSCQITNHDFGYRSVHYLLKFAPEKRTEIVELQVRTIFEEAWSEVICRPHVPLS